MTNACNFIVSLVIFSVLLASHVAAEKELGNGKATCVKYRQQTKERNTFIIHILVFYVGAGVAWVLKRTAGRPEVAHLRS